jgi:hypothetical protein
MSFRPSALSGRYFGDAEAETSGSSPVASTGSDIAAGVKIAGSLFETGASVYQTAQAAKAAKDEARRRAKRRKKQASASTSSSSTTPPVVAPTESKTDWVKWGLVGLAGVAAIAVFFAVRQKPETEPARLPVVPRSNPRPKARRVVKRVITEEMDEADEADGPDEAEE